LVGIALASLVRHGVDQVHGFVPDHERGHDHDGRSRSRQAITITIASGDHFCVFAWMMGELCSLRCRRERQGVQLCALARASYPRAVFLAHARCRTIAGA
jgi:hypothetical protein